MYRLSLSCILALVLGCVPGCAVAQVTMEARLGLQGALRLGKWNMVTVQVHNAGAAVLGTLGVRTWLGSEAQGDFHTTAFTRPVELPPDARKRFTFAVPISVISLTRWRLPCAQASRWRSSGSTCVRPCTPSR